MPFAANVRRLWRANENSRKTDVVVLVVVVVVAVAVAVVVVVVVVYLVGSACKTQVYTECRPWNITTKGCDDHENRAQCNMMLKTLQDDIQQTHINRNHFLLRIDFQVSMSNFLLRNLKTGGSRFVKRSINSCSSSQDWTTATCPWSTSSVICILYTCNSERIGLWKKYQLRKKSYLWFM